MGMRDSLDVSLPLNGSIDRSSPAWTTSLLDEYTTTINAFLKVSRISCSDTLVEHCLTDCGQYNNVLAFNVGNEVINLPSNTNAARKLSRATVIETIAGLG